MTSDERTARLEAELDALRLRVAVLEAQMERQTYGLMHRDHAPLTAVIHQHDQS